MAFNENENENVHINEFVLERLCVCERAWFAAKCCYTATNSRMEVADAGILFFFFQENKRRRRQKGTRNSRENENLLPDNVAIVNVI